MGMDFVVLARGCNGALYPLARTRHQSRAIGYAYMCKNETFVRRCKSDEVVKFTKSFHVLNLD